MKVNFTGWSFWLTLAVVITMVLTAVLLFLDLVDARNLVPLSDNYDWLAFVGAVLGGALGGLLTFGGVYLTLRQHRDAEDLKNRLSIMPLLEYSVSCDPADFDNSVGQLADEPGMAMHSIDGGRHADPESFEFLFDLIVRNVGLGHALLTDVNLDVRDNHDRPVDQFSGGYVNFIVKRDARRDIRMFFYAPRNPERFRSDPTQVVYALLVTVRYHDLLDNEYEQVVRTSLAKSLYAGEDPQTGGSPVSSFHYAGPPEFIGKYHPRLHHLDT